MAKVNPTAQVVTDATAILTASLAAGFGPGATSTHHRAAVLAVFGHAVADPRVEAEAEFDPEADYTKLGARGIELALGAYTKFLHDPDNMIVYSRGDPGEYTVSSSSAETVMQNLCVDMVDMILAYTPAADRHFTEVWEIAVGDYEPTWVDDNQDGVDDEEQVPVNLVAPVLSNNANELSVTNGTWTGSPDTFAYTWYLDGEIVADEDGSTLTLASGDDDGTYTVQVVATNDLGDSEGAISNALEAAYMN